MRLTLTDKIKLKYLNFFRDNDFKKFQHKFKQLDKNDQKLAENIAEHSYEKSMEKFEKINKSSKVKIEICPEISAPIFGVTGIGICVLSCFLGLDSSGTFTHNLLTDGFLATGLITMFAGAIETLRASYSEPLKLRISKPFYNYRYEKAKKEQIKSKKVKQLLNDKETILE